MAQAFRLPDLGEGIHEAEIREVLASPGAQVKEGQNILVVETDKAVIEVPSPFTGVVEEVRVQPDQTVEVGDVLLTLAGGEEAPEAEAAVGERARARQARTPETTAELAPAEQAVQQERAVGRGEPVTRIGPARPAEQRAGPVPASPATRRLARELGVDLDLVLPSGPGGRVTAEDVRSFAEQAREAPREVPGRERKPTPPEAVAPSVRPAGVTVPPLPDFSVWGPVEREPLRSVRRATARQMAIAWSQIPHVTHQDVADITDLEQVRERFKDEIDEKGGRLTPTVFVMKAVVAALKAYPRFNASLDAEAEEIILKRYYHIGIAVDTDRGLIVPVIHDVDRKNMTELSLELYQLVNRVRDGKATLEDLQGGTFTITNVGMLGGTAFAPVINYPQVAILGMARAAWQPVVKMDEEETDLQIEPRLMLPLMLAFDHRVVDGADAARFARFVVEVLEDPEKMLLML